MKSLKTQISAGVNTIYNKIRGVKTPDNLVEIPKERIDGQEGHNTSSSNEEEQLSNKLNGCNEKALDEEQGDIIVRATLKGVMVAGMVWLSIILLVSGIASLALLLPLFLGAGLAVSLYRDRKKLDITHSNKDNPIKAFFEIGKLTPGEIVTGLKAEILQNNDVKDFSTYDKIQIIKAAEKSGTEITHDSLKNLLNTDNTTECHILTKLLNDDKDLGKKLLKWQPSKRLWDRFTLPGLERTAKSEIVQGSANNLQAEIAQRNESANSSKAEINKTLLNSQHAGQINGWTQTISHQANKKSSQHRQQ